MANIFLSYSSSDRDLARQTATSLGARGHTVWWDTELIGGEEFRSAIDRELNEAQVVIVLWTPASIKSKWVIAEADDGLRLEKLLTLRTDSVQNWQIPKPFGTLHTETVGNDAGILRAVERIANHSGPAPDRIEHQDLRFNDAARRAAEASAETQIATNLIVLGLLLVFGSLLAAYWNGTHEIDKAKLLLAGGATTTVLVAAWCFRICRGTMSPVYTAMLTSVLTNIGVHAWLFVGAFAAYILKSKTGDSMQFPTITLFASIGVIAIYAVLLLFQVRGASWVLPAARLLAFVQAGAHAAHLARQWEWASHPISWFTHHTDAFLHALYVATGVSGVAVALAFVISSYLYATKLSSAR